MMKFGYNSGGQGVCRYGKPSGIRRGFTLIELMMVISIILLLMALMTPAITEALNMVNVVRTKNTIALIGTGLEAFKQDFGYYPPSSGGGADALYDAVMGPSGDGWPSGGLWPDGSSAGAEAQKRGPYVKTDPDMERGGRFQDGFRPSLDILYWRADISGTQASNIFNLADNTEYDAGTDDFYYMICGNTSGTTMPVRSKSYILLSRGKDRKWGYRDTDGNDVNPQHPEAKFDDIRNFR